MNAKTSNNNQTISRKSVLTSMALTADSTLLSCISVPDDCRILSLEPRFFYRATCRVSAGDPAPFRGATLPSLKFEHTSCFLPAKLASAVHTKHASYFRGDLSTPTFQRAVANFLLPDLLRFVALSSVLQPPHMPAWFHLDI